MVYGWLLSLCVPPVILAGYYLVFRRRLGLLRGAALSIAAIIAIVVGSSRLEGRHLKAQLDSFDLDGDGMFTGDEICPEEEESMVRYTSDVGRTFAPITGTLFAVMYSAIFFGTTSLVRSMRTRRSS